MTRAAVAYEAKRKPAVRPLRWHRAGDGRYEAKGSDGQKYVVVHRPPDRRHGKFPWLALRGGVRGVELKPGGFDTAADAKDFASKAAAGLCGPAMAATTTGVFPGTMAGEAKSVPFNEAYWGKVEAVLKRMGFSDAELSNSNSGAYVARMAAAGIDPEISAAVVAGSIRHAHKHDSPGKHTEMFEGAEEDKGYPREHLETFTFRGQKFQVYFGGHTNSWHYVLPGGAKKGGFESRDAAMVGAQRALGMLSSASVAVEEAAAAEEAKKRLPQPDPGSGFWVTRSSLTRNYFLMHGDRLIGQFDNRDDALKAARDRAAGEAREAGEARRPKGPSRR